MLLYRYCSSRNEERLKEKIKLVQAVQGGIYATSPRSEVTLNRTFYSTGHGRYLHGARSTAQQLNSVLKTPERVVKESLLLTLVSAAL